MNGNLPMLDASELTMDASSTSMAVAGGSLASLGQQGTYTDRVSAPTVGGGADRGSSISL